MVLPNWYMSSRSSDLNSPSGSPWATRCMCNRSRTWRTKSSASASICLRRSLLSRSSFSTALDSAMGNLLQALGRRHPRVARAEQVLEDGDLLNSVGGQPLLVRLGDGAGVELVELAEQVGQGDVVQVAGQCLQGVAQHPPLPFGQVQAPPGPLFGL